MGKMYRKMQGQISIFTCQVPVTLSKYSYALDLDDNCHQDT